MLFLSNVTMHNIGQYGDITVPISTGLFAVCGKNGIGKTTLLRAIAYGLTGLVDGSWGTQQSLQKDGTVDAGYVQITLVADTDVYRITRYTTSNPKYADKVDKLVDDSYESCITRRRSVDAFLSDLYGINVTHSTRLRVPQSCNRFLQGVTLVEQESELLGHLNG